jgi:hypothetical protein
MKNLWYTLSGVLITTALVYGTYKMVTNEKTTGNVNLAPTDHGLCSTMWPITINQTGTSNKYDPRITISQTDPKMIKVWWTEGSDAHVCTCNLDRTAGGTGVNLKIVNSDLIVRDWQSLSSGGNSQTIDVPLDFVGEDSDIFTAGFINEGGGLYLVGVNDARDISGTNPQNKTKGRIVRFHADQQMDLKYEGTSYTVYTKDNTSMNEPDLKFYSDFEVKYVEDEYEAKSLLSRTFDVEGK